MRLVIDGISKVEAQEMIRQQYGIVMGKVIKGQRVSYPNEGIEVRLFNVDSDRQIGTDRRSI